MPSRPPTFALSEKRAKDSEEEGGHRQTEGETDSRKDTETESESDKEP